MKCDLGFKINGKRVVSEDLEKRVEEILAQLGKDGVSPESKGFKGPFIYVDLGKISRKAILIYDLKNYSSIECEGMQSGKIGGIAICKGCQYFVK